MTTPVSKPMSAPAPALMQEPTQGPSKSTPQPPNPQTHEDVDLSCESVAGEEDPGASLDLSAAPEPASGKAASTQKVPE